MQMYLLYSLCKSGHSNNSNIVFTYLSRIIAINSMSKFNPFMNNTYFSILEKVLWENLKLILLSFLLFLVLLKAFFCWLFICFVLLAIKVSGCTGRLWVVVFYEWMKMYWGACVKRLIGDYKQALWTWMQFFRFFFYHVLCIFQVICFSKKYFLKDSYTFKDSVWVCQHNCYFF